jgi:alkylhydroperoxidase family enzyme
MRCWVEIAREAATEPNVVACHSLNAAAMRAHLALYRTIMFGQSGLSRPEREAIAVCVSAANDCHY